MVKKYVICHLEVCVLVYVSGGRDQDVGGGGEAGGVSGLVCILYVEHPSSSPVGTHLDRL